jgi:hypothetical protein
VLPTATLAALSITRRAYRAGGVTNSPVAARRLRSEGVPYGQYRHFVHAGRQLYLCARCQPGPSPGSTGEPTQFGDAS